MLFRKPWLTVSHYLPNVKAPGRVDLSSNLLDSISTMKEAIAAAAPLPEDINARIARQVRARLPAVIFSPGGFMR